MALTDAEKAELAQLEQELGQAPEPEVAPEPTLRQMALKGLGKALDYTSGLGRTAVAGAIDPFVEDDVLKQGDVMSALKGEAVPGEEILKRAGMAEGPRYNLFPEVKIPLTDITLGEGDSSTRDIAGFGLEVAADPLTYLTLGGAKLARPLATATEKSGEKLFKSGLKKIDERVLEQGAEPLSDLLLKEGVSGTTKKIQKGSKQLQEVLEKRRQQLLELGDRAGAMVDPTKAVQKAEARIAKITNPNMQDLRERLQTTIDNYKNSGPLPLSQANEWKTDLYNSMPDTAFDPLGKLKGPAKKIEKDLSLGFKKEIEGSFNSAVPGGGDLLASNNKKTQTLIKAEKPLRMQARRANTINAFTPIDAMITSGSALASQNPLVAAAMLGTKKAADLSKTTAFRTTAGLGMNRFGKAPIAGGLMDVAARRYFAEKLNSPWLKIPTGEDNGY